MTFKNPLDLIKPLGNFQPSLAQSIFGKGIQVCSNVQRTMPF